MRIANARKLTSLVLALAAVAVSAVALAGPAGAGRPVFNPVCLGTKIEGGTSGTYAMTYGEDTGTIAITVTDTDAGPVVGFSTDSASHVVGSVDVKGGTSILTWNLVTLTTPNGVTSASGLHADVNPSNGKWYGVSYLCFSTAKVIPDGGEF